MDGLISEKRGSFSERVFVFAVDEANTSGKVLTDVSDRVNTTMSGAEFTRNLSIDVARIAGAGSASRLPAMARALQGTGHLIQA